NRYPQLETVFKGEQKELVEKLLRGKKTRPHEGSLQKMRKKKRTYVGGVRVDGRITFTLWSSSQGAKGRRKGQNE
ncbi:hypothetical protein HHI36_015424, partial [Cryptolaemus montrouzieri]